MSYFFTILLFVQYFFKEVFSECPADHLRLDELCVKCPAYCLKCELDSSKNFICTECQESYTLISQDSINICTGSSNSRTKKKKNQKLS